jgi:hypothetical protein
LISSSDQYLLFTLPQPFGLSLKYNFSMSGYRPLLFRIASILAFIAAGYHFIGLFYPVNSAPQWRHALFVVIDSLCAYGLIKRPKYFIYFFFLFLAQQFYTHGGRLLSQWNDHHTIDWISILVLLFMPTVFIQLIIERKNRETESSVTK